MNNYSDVFFKERGRTREGVDCWGLVCLFYKDFFNIELEDHLDCYSSVTDRTIAVRAQREIETVWQNVKEPRKGDVILCRLAGRPMHVGLYIPIGNMLHIERGSYPVIEELGGIKWKNRILGFYRHKNLM